jgi:hypothetical protein
MNHPVKHDVPDDIRSLFTELRKFLRSKSPLEIAKESGLAEGTAHRLRYGHTFPTRLTNKNRRLLEAYLDRLRSGRIVEDRDGARGPVRKGEVVDVGGGESDGVRAMEHVPTSIWLAYVEHYLSRIGLFVKSQRHALEAQTQVLDRIEADISALCAVLRSPTPERLELPEIRSLEQTVEAAIRARHMFEAVESVPPGDDRPRAPDRRD